MGKRIRVFLHPIWLHIIPLAEEKESRKQFVQSIHLLPSFDGADMLIAHGKWHHQIEANSNQTTNYIT